jgi:hypothetical protein
MNYYFKQTFLRASGIYDHLSNPAVYKKNLRAGSNTGKSKGREVGYRWITNINVGVE